MNIPKTSQSTKGEKPVTEPGDSPVVALPTRGRLSFVGTLLAGAVLVSAAAAVGWLALPHGGTHPVPTTAARPTVSVGYAVSGSGTAHITYTKSDGTSHTINAHLPWKQTASVDAHNAATVNIVLGPEGGHATCTLTLHGTAIQHSTAYGAYGRATCTTTAPAG